jgi:hypothetical protein
MKSKKQEKHPREIGRKPNEDEALFQQRKSQAIASRMGTLLNLRGDKSSFIADVGLYSSDNFEWVGCNENEHNNAVHEIWFTHEYKPKGYDHIRVAITLYAFDDQEIYTVGKGVFRYTIDGITREVDPSGLGFTFLIDAGDTPLDVTYKMEDGFNNLRQKLEKETDKTTKPHDLIKVLGLPGAYYINAFERQVMRERLMMGQRVTITAVGEDTYEVTAVNPQRGSAPMTTMLSNFFNLPKGTQLYAELLK